MAQLTELMRAKQLYLDPASDARASRRDALRIPAKKLLRRSTEHGGKRVTLREQRPHLRGTGDAARRFIGDTGDAVIGVQHQVELQPRVSARDRHQPERLAGWQTSRRGALLRRPGAPRTGRPAPSGSRPAHPALRPPRASTIGQKSVAASAIRRIAPVLRRVGNAALMAASPLQRWRGPPESGS